MKKTILTVASLLSLLIAPAPAFALFNVNQGGTGQAFFTAGSLLYGNGTNPLATTTPGTLGYVLQFNGTFPTWVSPSSLGIVAGSDREIQFNNSGTFGADYRLKWGEEYGSGVLTIGGTATTTIGSLGQSTIGGYQLNIGQTLVFNHDQDNWGIDASNGSVDGLLFFAAFPNVVATFASNGAGGYREASFDISSISPELKRVFSFPNYDGTFGLLEANLACTRFG